ncbi:MAG: type II secretion system protein [Candidatus Muiribacteriota bacterium]
MLLRGIKRGITLVEILITLVVIVILITSIYNVYDSVVLNARIKRMHSDMETLKNEVLKFRIKYSRYPVSLTELEGEFLLEIPEHPADGYYYFSIFSASSGERAAYIMSETEDNPDFENQLLVGPVR